MDQLQQLQSQVEELRAQLNAITNFQRTYDPNLGWFSVVDTAPSGVPSDPYDQIRVYTNGSTYRLYWYDWNAGAWHYVTATA